MAKTEPEKPEAVRRGFPNHLREWVATCLIAGQVRALRTPEANKRSLAACLGRLQERTGDLGAAAVSRTGALAGYIGEPCSLLSGFDHPATG